MICRVRWDESDSKANLSDLIDKGPGVGALIATTNDPNGHPAGLVVNEDGRIVVVRLQAMRFDSWEDGSKEVLPKR